MLSLSDINPDPEKLVEQIKLNNGRSLVCKHDRYLHNELYHIDFENILVSIDVDFLVESNNDMLLEDALYQLERIHCGNEF